MPDIRIKMSDITKYPGARFIDESTSGSYSGEKFRNEVIEPNYRTAIATNSKLIIDIDGVYGYPSSFCNEAFGGFVRELVKRGDKQFSLDKLWETVELVSENPDNIKEVKQYTTKKYDRSQIIKEGL